MSGVKVWSLAALLVLAACGTSGSAPPTTTPGTATAAARAADVSATAERIETPVQIAMIGGSEVEYAGVSLAAELAATGLELGDRPTGVHAYTTIAAMPEHDVAAIAQAVADGADVLVITLNIAWLTWEEPACNPPEGTTVDPVERYVCVLSPISDAVTARRDAELRRLIDTVVATGLPALLYAIPHSTNALGDPRIADLIATREQQLSGYDPQLDHIRFVAGSFTRGRSGFTEPEAFGDMVHPTETGAQLIAEWLADELRKNAGARVSARFARV